MSLKVDTPSSGTPRSPIVAPSCLLVEYLPPELHVFVLTYLRATDLSALQRTCRTFNDRTLVRKVIEHTACYVYPTDLTEGYDTPIIGGETARKTEHTYESLRNMEMLVVARVLSRPEPSARERETGFYVSKSWCRAALRWLEFQQEERKAKEKTLLAAQSSSNHHGKKKRGKKLSKKEQRLRNRKMSDATPPWPNVNNDIICEHGDLRRCSSKAERARRRLLDKQAWKVLKRLYPDAVQLSSVGGECVQCALDAETQKTSEVNKKEQEREERRKPLTCPIVRGIYTRSRGVPLKSLVSSAYDSSPAVTLQKGSGGLKSTGEERVCPLLPGVYHALPRSWCHGWRRYLKTGEGDCTPPDASACLCDAHRLPLVPPHLEAYLYGETSALLAGITNIGAAANAEEEGNISQMDGQVKEGSSTASPRSAFASSTMGGIVKSPAPASALLASSHASPATVARRLPLGMQPIETGIDVDNNINDAHKLGNTDHNDNDEEKKILQALRAAGLSEEELQAQRLAAFSLEQQVKVGQDRAASIEGDVARFRLAAERQNNQQHQIIRPQTAAVASATPSQCDNAITESVNDILDRENRVVVEILTDEELVALERWWPEIHSAYALRFAVSSSDSVSTAGISWSTAPCRECDASGRDLSVTMRKRNRRWDKKR